MFEMLNLIYLGATMAANIMLYEDGPATDLYVRANKILPVSYHREWWRDDGKCHFKGVRVAYVRDWELTVNNGYVVTVLPPEPDKIAGHAFIINKKECPGQEPEAMFRVAESVDMSKFNATELSSMAEDQRPKWLPQVMKTLETASEHHAGAKDFMDFTNQAIAKAKAAKSNPVADATPAVAPIEAK